MLQSLTASKADEAAESHFPAFIGVQLWPNIQVEAQLPRASITCQAARIAGSGLTLIKVDHVFNALSTAALNDPVMSVERQLIAKPSVDSRTGTQELRINTKPSE